MHARLDVLPGTFVVHRHQVARLLDAGAVSRLHNRRQLHGGAGEEEQDSGRADGNSGGVGPVLHSVR